MGQSNDIFSGIFLPAAIALINFGMGLSLTFDDFRRIFKHPKAITTGLTAQLIFLPLLAFGLATSAGMLGIPPVLQVGLIIIAVCPGGTTSNLITHLLRGNVALSISMTATNSVITLVTIPTFTILALNYFIGKDADISMDWQDSILNIVLTIMIPCFIGIRVNTWFPEFAIKLDKPLRYIMPVILGLIFVGATFAEKEDGTSGLTSQHWDMLPYALVLNLVAMLSGFGLARMVGLRAKNQMTISIEVGLQNSGLAIYVAMTLIGNTTMAIPATVYAWFTFFTAVGFGLLVNRAVVKRYQVRKRRIKD